MSSKAQLQNIQSTGPYDTMRDYVAALEARGLLLRIKEMDQDRYDATGFAYRLMDKFGQTGVPAFLIERVKIDGRWWEGPIIGNIYGRWDMEAMVFGVEDIVDDQKKMYSAVLDKLFTRLDEGGQWKRLRPVSVNGRTAPCKEVIITGDDIDITEYPWLKNNPADAGRYINTGAVFIEDPRIGRNVGTYRCQVKGKTKIGLDANPGQHGGRLLNAMKARGEKVAKIAIALGVDPIIWSLSTSKLAAFGEDEIEVAGGIKGKPIELVKCETCDTMVPAHAEMIIEGEVPLHEGEDEGPYGEMYGYMGPMKRNNWIVNIKAVTRRHSPLFFNSYTGISFDMVRGPLMVNYTWTYKKLIPNLTGIYNFAEASGLLVAGIKKTYPGEAMQAGQYIAADPTVKVVIVVDHDLEIMNPLQILHALAARWQPSASVVIPQTFLQIPDPSRRVRYLSSKIVIDATKQLPSEGGPATWPESSRTLLEQAQPEIWERIDRNWAELTGEPIIRA